MKNLLKIGAVVLFAVSFVFILAGVTGNCVAATTKSYRTYLVAGFDDAAENTDVLSIFNVDLDARTIKIFQIPRDTYYNFGESQNKINQVFSSERSRGKSPDEAMKLLLSKIENQFSIEIDGYIGISTTVFKRIIDSFGGVYVNPSESLILKDANGNVQLELHKGENLLNSDQALTLVRYRSGYSRGDLGRMDAQKLFMRGFYSTLSRKRSFRNIIKAIFEIKGIVTDISFSDLVSILERSDDLTDASMTSVTLPGEAVKDKNGVWYYVINRKSAADLFAKHFSIDKNMFDPKRLFLNIKNEEFMKIYKSESIAYHEFLNDESIIIKS